MSDEAKQAESLLREIATDLMTLPLDERSRPLHLQVLALNRIVSSWSVVMPAPATLDSMLDALRVLRAQVHDVRSVSQVRLRSTYRPPSRKYKIG